MGQIINFPAPSRVFKAAAGYVECIVIVPHGEEFAAWVMTNECCYPLARGDRVRIWKTATFAGSHKGLPVTWPAGGEKQGVWRPECGGAA
jgi:hypothetical protein